MRRWVVGLVVVCGLMAAVPDGLAASTPGTIADDVVSTSATTATLDGKIDPSSQATTYKVEYDLASSNWCTSAGWSMSPAGTTNPQSLAFADETFHNVSVDLTGLTPGVRYCAQLYGDNASGEASDGQLPLVFTAGAPSVQTTDSDSTGAGTAQVLGTVNPAGQATTIQAQYDLDTSTWCQTRGRFGSPANTTGPQSLGYSDTTAHSVSIDVSGLTIGAAYCAQIVAQDASGSAPGGMTFLASVVSGPAVGLDAASPSDATTETLKGFVNPEGQPGTTYSFSYDQASSAWCSSDGHSGSPAYSTSINSTGMTNTNLNLWRTVTGLISGTAYCWQLSASNAGGSSQTRIGTFTPGMPTARTGVATESDADPTGVGISGYVNEPWNLTTTHMEYGLAGSAWCQSDGYTGTPDGSTHDVSLFPPGTFFIVGTAIEGLAPNTSYCFRTVATNPAGTSDGDTVTFTTPPTVALALSVDGGSGNVDAPQLSCPHSCTGSYFHGVPIQVHATPAIGAKFLGWGGACSGTGGCVVRMDQAQRVTAAFTVPPKCKLWPAKRQVRGKLALRVSCSQTAHVTLSGQLIRLDRHRKRRLFGIRAMHLLVRGGRTQLIEVRLPRLAVRRLSAHTTESVVMTLAASDSNGTSLITRRIRLSRL